MPNINDLLNYVELYPNASLKNYIDNYLNKEQIIKKQEEKLLEKKNNWFNNLINKYFIIKFNDASYFIFYLDKPLNLSDNSANNYKGFRLYFINGETHIVQKTLDINQNWFNNPYNNETNDTEVIEIDKVKYDDLIYDCLNINKLSSSLFKKIFTLINE